MEISANFWTQRYQEGQTGWDTGAITTPLKTYIDQLTDKDLRILIPGAGNAWEAEYLVSNGFRQVTVLDISPVPLQNLKQRVPGLSSSQMIQGDFFDHQGEYDLILEQTFFCALPPQLRAAYATAMHGLLAAKGSLVGVLFDAPMNSERPPFGGNREEYRKYFAPYFHFKAFDTCYNSISPRAGSELFIHLVKISR